MESIDYAVTRLTTEHTVITEGRSVEWPALVDWLSDAVTQQVKRGGDGSGGSSTPLDLTALALYQRIEKDTALIRAALYLPMMRDLKGAIRDAWDTAKQYRARGELDDLQWERISDRFPAWVADIEAEWGDRPRMMELCVPCPHCGERWVLEDSHGEPRRRTAVRIGYSEGRAPVAECVAEDCGTIWAGWKEVAKLGVTVNASQDLEVLAACGIDLRDMLAS